jgi:uncharacterized DUF497 family protein
MHMFDSTKNQINADKHGTFLAATAEFEWDDELVSAATIARLA